MTLKTFFRLQSEKQINANVIQAQRLHDQQDRRVHLRTQAGLAWAASKSASIRESGMMPIRRTRVA